MIFFSGDTHFGHANILKYDKRPFGSVDEMDRAIVENWNSYVTKDDVVYHLGDFSFCSKAGGADKYLNQLNGSIHIVFGNHDAEAQKIKNRFASARDMAYITVGDQKIHLCHYKFQVWRACHHGSWHLFGHSHGSLGPQHGKCLDVGIMTKDWAPGRCWLYSFGEIQARMRDLPIVGHHENTILEDQE